MSILPVHYSMQNLNDGYLSFVYTKKTYNSFNAVVSLELTVVQKWPKCEFRNTSQSLPNKIIDFEIWKKCFFFIHFNIKFIGILCLHSVRSSHTKKTWKKTFIFRNSQTIFNTFKSCCVFHLCKRWHEVGFSGAEWHTLTHKWAHDRLKYTSRITCT